jgi:hypothetical protein
MTILNILYQVFIGVLIAFKLMWVGSTIRARAAKRREPDSKKTKDLEAKAEGWEVASHMLMFALLILTFHPVNNPAEKIKIGREERIVFFVIGILGIVHLDYAKLSALRFTQ